MMRICSKCGIEKPAERFNGRRCGDCVAAYKRAHYEANRDKVIARAVEWNREHPERRKEITQGWVERNPDKRRESVARSSQRPAAKVNRRAYMAGWRKANPNRMRAYNWTSNHRRRDGFRAGPLVEWVEVLHCDPCSYCGGPAAEIDHIVPVHFGGATEFGNLASACRSCNAGKHTRSLLTHLLIANGDGR